MVEEIEIDLDDEEDEFDEDELDEDDEFDGKIYLAYYLFL